MSRLSVHSGSDCILTCICKGIRLNFLHFKKDKTLILRKKKIFDSGHSYSIVVKKKNLDSGHSYSIVFPGTYKEP